MFVQHFGAAVPADVHVRYVAAVLASRYRSVFAPELFAGRRIVVTGGGSGIGRCIAHELCSLGAHVTIVGRKRDKLERVVAELHEDGGAADLSVCDIRDEGAVVETVASILRCHGAIDALVNNAGGQFPSPLALISQKGFETVVRTNLVGGFLVAREVFTQCMADRGGAIVNMLADCSRGMPGMGHSGAARAGMENFTKTAAVEWAAAGVRVNAIAPGWVASSGMDTYEGAVAAMIPKLREVVPLKRLATESEVSAGVVYLLSPAAAFVTGVTLAVDGGAPLASGVWPMPDHARSQAFDGFHRSVVPRVLGGTGRPKHESPATGTQET